MKVKFKTALCIHFVKTRLHHRQCIFNLNNTNIPYGQSSVKLSVIWVLQVMQVLQVLQVMRVMQVIWVIRVIWVIWVIFPSSVFQYVH